MTAPTTSEPTPPEAQQPDELDALALQLVSLQAQITAMQGIVQASLMAVQILLLKRGRAGSTLPLLTRSGMGLPPNPDTAGAAPAAPRSFMSGRSAAPEAAAAGASTTHEA